MRPLSTPGTRTSGSRQHGVTGFVGGYGPRPRSRRFVGYRTDIPLPGLSAIYERPRCAPARRDRRWSRTAGTKDRTDAHGTEGRKPHANGQGLHLIRRPLEEIFDFIVDERSEHVYDPQLRSVEKSSPGRSEPAPSGMW